MFNWLFVRHNGGKFILRIEDTDEARSTPESIRGILEGMEWLGLDWDEGPYYQTDRIEIYQGHIDRLLNEGKAYHCYCSPEKLEEMRKRAQAKGQKPKYDGTCRNIANPIINKQSVVRFKSPQLGKTLFDDSIKGEVEFENSELDDLIIRRSNGSPTYNFSVVVDDATMGITHVIRGDDHLNNTPKQILLYQALGYPLPKFAHVPMILGNDGNRLSKRHGATSVMKYQEMGYLSPALVNYLVRLGWSHGNQEIFSRNELIDKFSLDKVGKSAGIFDLDKLLWLNGHYIKETETETLAKLLRPFIELGGHDILSNGYLSRVVDTLRIRSKTLIDMARLADFYFNDEIKYPEDLVNKFLKFNMIEIFETLVEKLGKLEFFEEKPVETIFLEILKERDIKFGKVAQPVRVALTGSTVSPGIHETIVALGKEKVLKRLNIAIELIKKGHKST